MKHVMRKGSIISSQLPRSSVNAQRYCETLEAMARRITETWVKQTDPEQRRSIKNNKRFVASLFVLWWRSSRDQAYLDRLTSGVGRTGRRDDQRIRFVKALRPRPALFEYNQRDAMGRSEEAFQLMKANEYNEETRSLQERVACLDVIYGHLRIDLPQEEEILSRLARTTWEDLKYDAATYLEKQRIDVGLDVADVDDDAPAEPGRLEWGPRPHPKHDPGVEQTVQTHSRFAKILKRLRGRKAMLLVDGGNGGRGIGVFLEGGRDGRIVVLSEVDLLPGEFRAALRQYEFDVHDDGSWAGHWVRARIKDMQALKRLLEASKK